MYYNTNFNKIHIFLNFFYFRSIFFDENPFTKYFERSIWLGFVAFWYAILTTLYPMIMIGSCMCFETCIDDLILSLKEIDDVFADAKQEGDPNFKIFFKSSLIEVIEYQIECIT